MKTSRLSVFAILVLLTYLLTSCGEEVTDRIMTVNGPIDATAMGLTLSHEHLLVDFIGADSIGYHRWDRDSVVSQLMPYLEELKAHNVRTFVDATPAYLGRDPELLKMLSGRSGLNIITNTGYYGARDNLFVPSMAMDMSAEEIASLWIEEHENGIENSGVFPGFIKIGVDRSDTLSDIHKKIVRAAAIAHKATGLVIASHTGPEAPAFEQLKILEEYGVDPSAFIWVHAQRGSIEGIIKAARMGAWISLDNINARREKNPDKPYSSSWYLERLRALKDEGLLHRVHLSHDAGWYRPGEPSGGNIRGYTDLFTILLPVLKKEGFTDEEIDQILVTNPMKAFAIRK